MTPDDSSAYSI